MPFLLGEGGWIFFLRDVQALQPGRLTWNLQITNLERKMIFQASMIMLHVNLPGFSKFEKTRRLVLKLDRTPCLQRGEVAFIFSLGFLQHLVT